MELKTVRLDTFGRVTTITLNRPDKRNAMSYELIDDLLRALAASRDAGVVIITGAGKAFCAGMDLDNLREITSHSHQQNLADSQKMADLFRAIYDFPAPTIAAVNGAAVAGGCGVATLCDFTIATTEAKFGYTEVRIGFLPAIVSTFLLRQVGEKIARDLLLTGRIIGADEALRLGLCSEIVEPERLMSRAEEIAAAILENAPGSVRATKNLLSSYSKIELDDQIRLAVDENARIRATEDFREGVTAFLEKRKPKWSQ
jgi:methylglutaconyl-CoA hydratase